MAATTGSSRRREYIQRPHSPRSAACGSIRRAGAMYADKHEEDLPINDAPCSGWPTASLGPAARQPRRQRPGAVRHKIKSHLVRSLRFQGDCLAR